MEFSAWSAVSSPLPFFSPLKTLKWPSWSLPNDFNSIITSSVTFIKLLSSSLRKMATKAFTKAWLQLFLKPASAATHSLVPSNTFKSNNSMQATTFYIPQLPVLSVRLSPTLSTSLKRDSSLLIFMSTRVSMAPWLTSTKSKEWKDFTVEVWLHASRKDFLQDCITWCTKRWKHMESTRSQQD